MNGRRWWSQTPTPAARRLTITIFFAAVLGIFWFGFLAEGLVYSAHPDFRDQGLPLLMLQGEFFRKMTLPQWNPFTFCGLNFMGAGDYAFPYPPMWLVFLAPPHLVPVALTLFAIGHQALALAAGYLFLSEHVASPAMRVAFSVAMAFSAGAVADLACTPNSYNWLPYTVLALYLVGTAKRRPFPNGVALLAITVAMPFLNGVGLVPIYGVALVVGYTLAVHGFGREGRPWVLQVCLGVAIGCGLCAFRLVPFFRAAESVLHESPEQINQFLDGGGATLLHHLLRAFLPFFPGLESAHPFARAFGLAPLDPRFDPMEHFACYAGLPTALFALYGIVYVRTRPAVVLSAFCLLITVAVVARPLAVAHAWLTGSPSLYVSRLAYFLPLFEAPLAAIALDRVLENPAECGRFVRFGSLVSIGVVVLAIAAVHDLGPVPTDRAGSVTAVSLGIFAVFSAATLAVPWWVSRIERLRPAARPMLGILLVADVLFASMVLRDHPDPFLASSPHADLTRDDREMIARVHDQGGMFRALGRTPATRRNRAILHGFRSPAGHETTPPYRTVNILRYPDRHYDRSRAKDISRVEGRALALTSTRYLSDIHGFRVVADAIPRLELFHRVEVIEDEERALERLFDADFDFHEVLVVDRDVSLGGPDPSASRDVRVVRDGLNAIEVLVETSTDAVLLVNDSWDPGWHARLDGSEVPILKANHAFMGLGIPAGSHRVRLQYLSPGLGVGSWLSLVSLLLLSVMTGLAIRARARP